MIYPAAAIHTDAITSSMKSPPLDSIHAFLGYCSTTARSTQVKNNVCVSTMKNRLRHRTSFIKAANNCMASVL